MSAQTEVARLDRPAADAVQMVEGQYRKVEGMPQFDPHLVRIMRDVLEDIMTRVPTEQSTQAVKAYLAECILKAAAQGHTNYDALMAAAADQIHVILSLLS